MGEGGEFEKPKSGKERSEDIKKRQAEKGFGVIEGGLQEQDKKPDTFRFNDLPRADKPRGTPLEAQRSILGHDYAGSPDDDEELKNQRSDLAEK